MVNSMSYRIEKFSTAILEMASGDGSVQERLMRAVAANSLLLLDADFDDDLREDYKALEDRLKRGLTANYRDMNPNEAREIIDKIISIYSELCRLGE